MCKIMMHQVGIALLALTYLSIKLRGLFNESLENPRDGARSIEHVLVLVSIITH